MNRVISVLRLHLARRFAAFLMPIGLSVGIVIAMILVVAAIRLAGVDTLGDGFSQGMANNGGMVYSLLGFLIVLGVQAATSCFAFAMALGVTRTHYVAGTALYFAIQSAIVTAVLAVLLALELATYHWFIGARALDVVMLGSANWGRFLVIAYLGVLAALALGALFGASWLRFGSRGPLVIGGIAVIALAVTLFFAIPRFAEIMAAVTFAWVPISLLLVILVGFGGATAFLRRASVRGS